MEPAVTSTLNVKNCPDPTNTDAGYTFALLKALHKPSHKAMHGMARM